MNISYSEAFLFYSVSSLVTIGLSFERNPILESSRKRGLNKTFNNLCNSCLCLSAENFEVN